MSSLDERDIDEANGDAGDNSVAASGGSAGNGGAAGNGGGGSNGGGTAGSDMGSQGGTGEGASGGSRAGGGGSDAGSSSAGSGNGGSAQSGAGGSGAGSGSTGSGSGGSAQSGAAGTDTGAGSSGTAGAGGATTAGAGGATTAGAGGATTAGSAGTDSAGSGNVPLCGDSWAFIDGTVTSPGTGGCWHGGSFITHSPTTTSSAPAPPSSCAAGCPVCQSGTITGQDPNHGYFMFGFYLNERIQFGPVVPGGTHLDISVSNPGGTALSVVLQDLNNQLYCYALPPGGSVTTSIPYSAFNTECWSGGNGIAYAGQGLYSVALRIDGQPGGLTFDACINSARDN